MAKVRPKIPNRKPGEPGDRNPDLREPRPSERDPVFKEIGKIITDEWLAAAAGKRQLDRDKLQQAISAQLRLAGDDDPMGDVEIGIIVDPKPEQGRKFVWIVIPYPEHPNGTKPEDWQKYYEKPQVQQQLGEAVLFGCGR
ncbi:MAG: hypothetical protein JNM20_06640 [Rhizobiales bacterium]|nr:hypothetical protein [Hyphomicrobiales bacterium]